MDKLEKELIELKKVLDAKMPKFKDEFQNKLNSLSGNSEDFTYEIFMRNQQKVLDALSDVLDDMHNSKEYLDVTEKELELTFSKFASFDEVCSEYDIKTYKPIARRIEFAPKFVDNDMKHNSLIKLNEKSKCMICGNLTEYMDYCAEIRICSKECQNEFHKLIDEQEKLFYESENNK